MKDHINQTKEMLEARVEAVTQFEDKIGILGDELTKGKQVHEDFRKKIINEIGKTNQTVADMKVDINKHMEEYQATFLNNEFFMDKSNAQMKIFEKTLEQTRAYTEGKFEQLSFDITRRVKVEDLRQNFK